MRDILLTGDIELPSWDLFETHFGEEYADLAEAMLRSLFNHYIKNKGTTSTLYWAERFENPKVFNQILKIMSDNQWIVVHTIPERHWSEMSINEDKLLTYLSSDELVTMRKERKFLKYIPCFNIKDRVTLVKQGKFIKQTGLIREGLAKSANTQFYYDTEMLARYADTIITNTNKGMSKCRELMPDMVHDEASYDEISTDIVNNLIKQPFLMTMEGNISDSRGRAIKGALKKVANPIGYKDFRALLTIPE